MYDLPLVVFTVMSQLAVGGLITLYILDMLKKDVSLKAGRLITISLIAILGISLLVSLLHLGKPFEAYRSITHLGSSWLSREILFFSLLFVSTIFYVLQWKSGKEKSRRIAGGFVSIVGTLSVVSSAMIYVLPAVPSWNNVSSILFFLLTAAVLGPLFVMSMLALIDKKDGQMIKLITSFIAVYMVITVMYVSILLSGGSYFVQSAQNMVGDSLFWIRGVLSWIIPLVVFFIFLFNKKLKLNSPIFLFGLFFIVLVGEVLGRGIFYGSAEYLEILHLVNK